MIAEFSARLKNGIMLFDLLRITESTGFTKRRHRSDLTDSNIKSTNNLNCSQDGPRDNS